MSKYSGGKLLVAELPVHPNKLETPIDWSKFVDENGSNYPLGETTFESVIYGDSFNFVEMDPDQNKVSLIRYIKFGLR